MKENKPWYTKKNYFSPYEKKKVRALFSTQATIFILVFLLFLAIPLWIFEGGPITTIFFLPLYIPIITLFCLTISQFKKFICIYKITKNERYLFYFGAIGISLLIGFIFGPILWCIIEPNSIYPSFIVNCGFIIFNINYFVFFVNHIIPYKKKPVAITKLIYLCIFIISIYPILYFWVFSSPNPFPVYYPWMDWFYVALWFLGPIVPFMVFNLCVLGFTLKLMYCITNKEYNSFINRYKTS